MVIYEGSDLSMESHDEPNVDISDDDYNTITYERNKRAVIDANSTPEHDGRAVTNTGFNPNDVNVDEGRHHWEWLNKLNDGLQSRERKQQNNEVNQRRFAETVMDELGCTDFQQERVNHLLASQDGRSHGGKCYEIVVLALISMVLEEDGRYVREEDDWVALRDDLVVDGTDVGKHDITSVRFSLEDNDIMSEEQSTKSLQV